MYFPDPEARRQHQRPPEGGQVRRGPGPCRGVPRRSGGHPGQAPRLLHHGGQGGHGSPLGHARGKVGGGQEKVI